MVTTEQEGAQSGTRTIESGDVRWIETKIGYMNPLSDKETYSVAMDLATSLFISCRDLGETRQQAEDSLLELAKRGDWDSALKASQVADYCGKRKKQLTKTMEGIGLAGGPLPSNEIIRTNFIKLTAVPPSLRKY